MDINTIFLIGGASFFIYLIYASLKPKHTSFIPQRSGLLVAQDTGKTKVNQSKTGDASLAIERVRRQTIQSVGRVNKRGIKETRTQLGSSTGAVETFMITGICPPLPFLNLRFDGGGASSEYCNILTDTGAGVSYDAGGAECQECDGVAQVRFDGGTELSENCVVLEGDGGYILDAGNQSTTVCGI